MTSARLSLLVAAACLPLAGQIYKDPSQPLEKRVDDLLARMTLEERASQLLSASPAIDRLGVPAYDWWNECLHGVARAGRATVFPETIGVAATWDTDLLFRMATAISDEARAKHHEFVRRGKRGIYQGLTFWTPNINIFRDPRWGRGMETYGEDPYLTGRMAVQFIRGLEGDDPKYLKVVATAKHYAVHSGPELTRHVFDARISDADLRDTYLPQFQAAVKEGGAMSVMCAYNSVDGLPACANPPLLEKILRGEWGFPGYVVSDCGAVGDIYQGHKAAKTAPEGVAMAIKAGTDLDCGLEYENVVPAVKQGLLAESDVDTALRRLLTARFKLGMFDPPEMVRWAQIPYAVNDSPEHQQLALETARKSIVLLKNEGGVLPLRRDLKTIAVIGPNADSVEVLLGNYNGEPSHPVTPLAGIQRKVSPGTKVLYARGSDLAEGMPLLETVPLSALFTSDGADKQNGLKAEYFNTAAFNGRAYFSQAFVSRAMRQAAKIPENPQPLFTRIDPQIDFNWWDGAPRADMDDDNFGVRWTGFLAPPVSGKYQLGATGLNAYEVYLNGKRLAGRDNVHERGYEYETVDLEAGKLYPIRVEFHEVHGDADIRLVWAPPHASYEDEALQIARQSDVVLMFLGLSPRLEGEEMRVQVEGFRGGDRVSLNIPRVQEGLLQRVSALGKPVVLVLLNGSAVAVNWAKEHVPAIVELWYPGQAGGAALADVLFGDYNPAGRLPVTFYKSEDQLPPFDDYNMKGRTYRYFEGEPLYPFGFGLSYTTFSYSNLQVPAEARAGSPLKISVDVRNSGKRAGEEVVQLYIKHPGVVRELQGFTRISLTPGQHKTVEFPLTRTDAGDIQIQVGGLVKSSRISQ
ncbi:MAG: glycoside hydrolase family 3 C-terminal domain-containing protein [Bryobacteraceae bacterium]|jgi:beta-glucosidase